MDLTRRGLIRRAAAASGALFGASLAVPRVVFAGAHGERVFAITLGRGSGRSDARAAAAARGGIWRSGVVETKPFELLGVDNGAGAEARARGLDGRWTDWLPLHAGHEGARMSDPAWTGPADAFEIRSRRTLAGARVLLVDGGHDARTSAVKYVDSGLPAGPGQPKIIGRSTWANASCRPRVQPSLGAVDLAFVHHTVNSNSYGPSQSAGMVRSICLFHKYGNGWDDIGYNFVIDRHGQVFEGRQGGIDESIVGAQAGGYNAYSTGVALLGNFAGAGPPRKMFDSLSRLLAWKLSLHGIPITGSTRITVTKSGQAYSRYPAGSEVELARISGHRDANATTCPGNAMYRQLPRLRQVIQKLAGTPSQLSLAIQATSPGNAVLGGLLTNAGVGVGGATIEIQQRRVTRGAITLASALTNPDGSWSASVPLARATALRALYRGDPTHSAVVSPGVVAVVPPAITLSAATQQTTPNGVIGFSGSVAPRKPKVTLVISQRQPDGSVATVRSIGVSTQDDGTFARSIGFPAAGSYQVVAHTSADDASALGTSAPVAITVA